MLLEREYTGLNFTQNSICSGLRFFNYLEKLLTRDPYLYLPGGLMLRTFKIPARIDRILMEIIQKPTDSAESIVIKRKTTAIILLKYI